MNIPNYIENLFPLEEGEQIAFVDSSPKTAYFVTSIGRLFSLSARSIEPNYNKQRGYYYLKTENGGKQLHRLVAKNFIPNNKGKRYVNHKDGNKRNNTAENLEWVTASENMKHAYKNGLMKPPRNAKYGDKEILGLVRLIKEEGYTYKAAAAKMGMTYSTAAHVMTGRRKLSNGKSAI